MSVPLALAFRPFRDSSQQGGLVEHQSSWMTVNTARGCPLGCVYCFRHKWFPAEQPTLTAKAQWAVDALLSTDGFEAHTTPVAVNVSATDPMLPSVRESTFSVLQDMDERGLQNVVGIVTKWGLRDTEVRRLKALRNLRPVVMISYAAMPVEVEPVSAWRRCRSLVRLRDSGLRRVLLYRPLVQGWNDQPQQIEEVLRLGDQYAEAIVIGGLRVSAEILAVIGNHGLRLTGTFGPFSQKSLPITLQRRLVREHRQLGIGVPMFKSISCGLSFLFAQGNYTNVRSMPGECLASCPRSQKALCDAVLRRSP